MLIRIFNNAAIRAVVDQRGRHAGRDWQGGEKACRQTLECDGLRAAQASDKRRAGIIGIRAGPPGSAPLSFPLNVVITPAEAASAEIQANIKHVRANVSSESSVTFSGSPKSWVQLSGGHNGGSRPA